MPVTSDFLICGNAFIYSRSLIGTLRSKYPDLPIHVHSHDTAGISLATMLQCAESGADVVDCAMDSMSGMTSQCAMGALCAALEQNGLGTGIRFEDIQALNVRQPTLHSVWEK